MSKGHKKACACEDYEIRIITAGRLTAAFLMKGGQTVKTAWARCNPKDAYSMRKGCELAFARLFEKSKGQKAVRRRAMPGDYIRIISPIDPHDGYGIGDVLRVTGTNEEKQFVNAKGAKHIIMDSEYVVLKGYKPRKEAADA